jgi:cytochrome c-type biogenesis protein CcmH/NrfG
MDPCVNCGQQLPDDANFCAACGTRRGESVARKEPPSAAPSRRISSLRVGVIVGAFILGGAVTAATLGVLAKQQARHQVGRPSRMEIPGSKTAALPTGHPQVRLPPGHPEMRNTSQVSEVVAKAESEARRRPKEIAVWNRYGDLAMRFAMFDPSNYAKARAAFSHVLELQSDNRDALRGLGNVYYDTHQYSKAIDAYNRYLHKQPDDNRVRTDLGTMYLSQHNGAEAVKEYQMVLARKAGFFPAQYNLAVAYLLLNDTARARDAFSKARVIAPDGSARARVDEMIAKVDGSTARNDPRDGNHAALQGSSTRAVSQ